MAKENQIITVDDEINESIDNIEKITEEMRSEINQKPATVRVRAKKRYFEILFDVDDENYFKDREVTLKFQQINEKRFSIIIKNECDALEMVRHISDNFKMKDIKLYNQVIGAIAQVLKVMKLTEACKEEVRIATTRLNAEVLALRKDNVEIKADNVELKADNVELKAGLKLKDSEISDLKEKVEVNNLEMKELATRKDSEIKNLQLQIDELKSLFNK
jgi:hypothetical protein